MKLKKNHTIILILLIFFLGFVYFNHKNFSKERTIVRLKGVSVNEPIEDFSITSKSVFLWADPVLYITDRGGNIIKKIQREDENIKVFFANNYAFLYEEDLGKVQMYSETGELLSTIDVKGEVFNISYENANIIFHIIDEKNEILYLMGNDSTLTEIYRTGNQILTHDVLDPKNLSIAEIKNDASGYSSLLYSLHKGNKKSVVLNHEIVFFVKKDKRSVLALTDKSMYRFMDAGKKYEEKIPNISDVLVEGRDTYLLHSGIITKYDYALKPGDKKIIAANVNKMENVSGSIYVYGPSDVGGEIGNRGEFYTRLGYSLDKIKINGLLIGALRNGELNLYSVVNSNSVRDDENKIETTYKEV
ncbi:hypothetical protein ACQRC6_02110 [Peptoniphilus sp. SGI.035]|uniref:hypothetical protein n=1 Tax=Peptoniphilus sp. SGI.035 TaxID=3420564 RepID=UPI003D00F7BE